ncbi:tyrosine-type recombinase/integrase [Campylobacter ureolyticus]|uniref:tyrosine-type recombinase/integrase n=1 Tax=Campylobacter ureolyticus TaxID=827 RepID=UPI0022B4A173|nr:tyrosine-type recombinase/integrase [Campylobacter ureolyticus]MCZ6102877.1 tyrosine-type recombinase/integrase [Campylobacter ureolyticus]
MATLTFTQVKKLKCPNDKKFKAFSIDSNCSLYLVCFNTGTRLYKKRIKTGYKTLGNFNKLSLAEARELAINYEEKDKIEQIKINDLFVEWLNLKAPNDKEKRRKYKNRVNKWILAKIGNEFVSEIGKDELLNALNGANFNTAKRALSIYRDMLKIAKNKCAINDISFIYEIIEDKDVLFIKPKTNHRKAITNKKRLLEIIKIVKNSGIDETIINMFLFNLIMAQRPHQIRELTWDRVDENYVYFNESDNKTKINARLPLPKKAKEILEHQKKLTGDEGIVFKSKTHSLKSGYAFSDMTLMANIKRLGIDDLHAHGFRGTLATFAIRETEVVDCVKRGKFEKRVIDEVLLHTRGSEVDKAYFRDFNSDEHKRLLEWWCEFLGF